MAKKKPLYGVNNYHKRTPKKRPGVHTKRLNKRKFATESNIITMSSLIYL